MAAANGSGMLYITGWVSHGFGLGGSVIHAKVLPDLAGSDELQIILLAFPVDRI